MRLPFTMANAEGTVVADGDDNGTIRVWDFRDLSGQKMPLPPGCTFQVILDPIDDDGSDHA